MLPGYLHFDVRRGLRADMLNAAMAALLPDQKSARDALDALGFQEISLVVNVDTERGILGRRVYFYANDNILISSEISQKRKSKSQVPLSAKWDGRTCNLHDKDGMVSEHVQCQNELLNDGLQNVAIPLARIRDVLFESKMKPAVKALSLKVLEKLECPIFSEHLLAGHDALWMLCHLVMLCSQIDALDPKFISATRVTIGSSEKMPPLTRKTRNLVDDSWVNALLTMMPISEIGEARDVDVLAIAFLKALTGQFGVRGNSTILAVGVGLGSPSSNGNQHIEALWCKPYGPESSNEYGPEQGARLNFVNEVSGLVSATSELPQLCGTLSLIGAKAISWQLVHGEKSHMHYLVKFLCNDNDKREVIEAFLIKGGAESVSVHLVEHHELCRRLVAVPMGTGNKTFATRFHEYTYYDKTIRVEPVKEDLDIYVQKTNYSTDVARSDLLLAWKKWRGRVATEN